MLNAWTHGDLLTIHMLGMSHTAFASMYQRASSDRKFAENQMDDYDRDDVNVSYAWVARYTLGFLNARLKGDTAEMSFLKATPAEHGVPRHFMTVDYRAATTTPRHRAGMSPADAVGYRMLYRACGARHPSR